MSVLWTSDDAVAATGGRATRAFAATGVSIDTRTIAPGDLFVALRDVRDGHDFVARALEKGAAAALVSRIPEGLAPDAPLLVVGDALEGLRGLARAARARMRGRVVGVTGSVGKTSTKEMLRTALAGQGRIHAAEGSFNNHWGVPLTLARMPADTDYAILEIGMNAPGEIGPLSRLSRLHVAMITAVAEAHMAAFRTVRDIAKAKAEIFEGLLPGGAAVLNRDTPTYPILTRAAAKAGARQIRYGFAGRPEYRLDRIKVRGDCTAASVMRGRERLMVKIGAPGKHLAMNAVGVIAVVEALGADTGRAAMALGRWTPPAGRGLRERIRVAGGEILLIDESYNANPTSVEAALEALAGTAVEDGIGRIAKGRRIAVLGDMLELGAAEIAMHAALADLPAMAAVDRVHLVGPRMQALAGRLPARRRGLVLAEAGAMAAAIRKELDAGDVVMVKASKGTALGQVVDAIRAMGKSLPADDRETR